MKNIVVIHTGAVGDLVQALPALRAVRAKWPQAQITLIGRPQRAALARMAGLADACLDVETCGVWRLLGTPNEAPADAPPTWLREADLVVDFFSGGRLEATLVGTNAVIVSPHPLPPDGWNASAAAYLYAQLAQTLALPAVPLEPEIPVPAAVVDAARKVLGRCGIGGSFAAIHPGSGSQKKNWPLERFAQIACRLRQQAGHSVVWLVGPAEVERGTAPPAAHGDAVLSDMALEEVAGVLVAADLYVGNDSGVTHLAAAVRRSDGAGKHPSEKERATPTVALFGPTDAAVWAPRGRHVRVVCSPDGTMAAIETEQVWHELADLLSVAE